MYNVNTSATFTVASVPSPPPNLSTSAENGITSKPIEKSIPLISNPPLSTKKEANSKSALPDALTASPPELPEAELVV